MNATLTAPAKFDRRAIALAAWSLVKTAGKTLSEGMKAAWSTAKQTVKAIMRTHITDIQVVVAENEDYKIYLQGNYNAAGLGDSRVHVLCKQHANIHNQVLWIGSHGWKETLQFVVSGWAAPAIDKAAVEAFLAQHATAITAAQEQFIEDHCSASDKAYSQGMDNLLNDRTEAIEDGRA